MASKKSASAEQAQQQPQVTLRGRLTKDPVLRTTKSGKPVSTIRIAVNPADGGEATFHNVVLWNRTAERVCEFVKKGRLVEIVGTPREREYEGPDGNPRHVSEVNAYRCQFSGLKAEQEVEAA